MGGRSETEKMPEVEGRQEVVRPPHLSSWQLRLHCTEFPVWVGTGIRIMSWGFRPYPQKLVG